LKGVSLLFGKFFISRQPDELIVRAQAKPGLVQHDDIISCSITLDFKHSKQSPGQIDSLAHFRLTKYVASIEGDAQ
jgi:hypothetical protein